MEIKEMKSWEIEMYKCVKSRIDNAEDTKSITTVALSGPVCFQLESDGLKVRYVQPTLDRKRSQLHVGTHCIVSWGNHGN